MKWCEIVDITDEECSAPLSEISDIKSSVDVQNMRADQLMQQGRLEKKRAQISRAEQEIFKRRRELARIRTKNQKAS